MTSEMLSFLGGQQYVFWLLDTKLFCDIIDLVMMGSCRVNVTFQKVFFYIFATSEIIA